jgi:hypothetical protein
MKSLFKLLIPLVIVIGTGAAGTLQFPACSNVQLQNGTCINSDGVTFTYTNYGGADQASSTVGGLSGSTFGSYSLLFPTAENYLNLLFAISAPQNLGALDPNLIAYIDALNNGGVTATLNLGGNAAGAPLNFPLSGATGSGDILIQNIAFDAVFLSFYPVAYTDDTAQFSTYPNQFGVSLSEGQYGNGVPEPGTLVLLGTSLMGLAFFAKRRLF